jgi:tetratricopeptide (TPR) repeat protein/O-antigen ligase
MSKAKKKKPSAKQQQRTVKTPAAGAVFSGLKNSNNIIDNIIALGPLVLIGCGPLVFYGQSGEFENVPKMAFLQCGIILLALLRIWHRKKASELVWEINPLDILFFLFYAFCWISLFQAPNPYLAVLPLLHYAAAILFYFFICNTTTDIKCIDRYFFVITLSVMAVSVVGIAQYLFNLTWIPQIVPPSSTLSNKNMAAHIISMSLPLCLGCLFISRSVWQRIICLSSIFITLLYSLYIKTRASWLATLVVFAVMGISAVPRLRELLRRESRKRIVLPAIVGSLFILLLILFSQLKPANIPVPILKDSIGERFLSITDFKEGDSAQLRIIWWENTLKMVKDHFWGGVGLQNFKIVYPLYHRAAAVDWSFKDEQQLTRVHNDHLQMLAELGIFGFCAYAALFIGVFFMFWQIYFSVRDEQIKFRALCIFLGVAGFVINAAFCFPLERAIPPVLLFSFFALLTVLYRISGKAFYASWKIRQHIPARVLLSILLMVLFVSSFYFIRKVMLADKYFVKAIMADKKGSIDDSNKSLAKARQYFSRYNSNISALLARNYTLQKKYDLAIEEYQETFRAHPYNTSAILNTGYCYLQLKRYDEAEKYFKWAIEIMPTFAQAYNDLGIIYFSKQQYDAAIAQYKKAFEINKNYSEPHINLGNLYRSLKKPDLAIQEYEAALGINQNLPETRQWLSGLYMERGQYDKAQEVLKPLLQIPAKTSAESYILQGNIYQKQRQYEKAVAEYVKALKLKPNNPLIYHNMGLAYFYLQNHALAEEYFKKALALKPAIAESNSMLGQIYLLKEDDRSALYYFESAVRFNPQLKDAQFSIGAIYLRLGDYDRAIASFQEVVRIDPQYAPAHYNLGTIYMERGNDAEALVHFEQVLKNPSPQLDLKEAEGFVASLKKKLNQ